MQLWYEWSDLLYVWIILNFSYIVAGMFSGPWNQIPWESTLSITHCWLCSLYPPSPVGQFIFIWIIHKPISLVAVQNPNAISTNKIISFIICSIWLIGKDCFVMEATKYRSVIFRDFVMSVSCYYYYSAFSLSLTHEVVCSISQKQ